LTNADPNSVDSCNFGPVVIDFATNVNVHQVILTFVGASGPHLMQAYSIAGESSILLAETERDIVFGTGPYRIVVTSDSNISRVTLDGPERGLVGIKEIYYE
jgi:hypothetical protein